MNTLNLAVFKRQAYTLSIKYSSFVIKRHGFKSSLQEKGRDKTIDARSFEALTCEDAFLLIHVYEKSLLISANNPAPKLSAKISLVIAYSSITTAVPEAIIIPIPNCSHLI